MSDGEEVYKNIRDVPCIKAVIGKRLVDVTQNDDGEPAKMFLMFEEATVIEIAVTEERGIIVSPGGD